MDPVLCEYFMLKRYSGSFLVFFVLVFEKKKKTHEKFIWFVYVMYYFALKGNWKPFSFYKISNCWPQILNALNLRFSMRRIKNLSLVKSCLQLLWTQRKLKTLHPTKCEQIWWLGAVVLRWSDMNKIDKIWKGVLCLVLHFYSEFFF